MRHITVHLISASPSRLALENCQGKFAITFDSYKDIFFFQYQNLYSSIVQMTPFSETDIKPLNNQPNFTVKFDEDIELI